MGSLSLAAGNSPEEVNCGNSAIEEMLRTHSSHSCEPRRVIVEVKGDWRRLNLLAPSHVEVLRCVGSCGHYQDGPYYHVGAQHGARSQRHGLWRRQGGGSS